MPVRLALAVLFAALLGLHSLLPPGFMPLFKQGSVMIIACPDGGASGAMSMHHHGDRRSVHQQCPYAAASALGAFGSVARLEPVTPFFSQPLCVHLFTLVDRQLKFERPPAIGPPML